MMLKYNVLAVGSSLTYAGKVFRSLETDLFHSPLPEKSSGPWSETIYILPSRKSLVSYYSSIGQSKMSNSRDWKTFPALGMEKLLWLSEKMFLY